MSLLILWQHGLWGIQGSPCIARDAVCCWCSLCLRHFGQGHNMRRSNDSAHSSDVYTQHCVKVKCCRYRKQEVPFPQNWFSTLIPNEIQKSRTLTPLKHFGKHATLYQDEWVSLAMPRSSYIRNTCRSHEGFCERTSNLAVPTTSVMASSHIIIEDGLIEQDTLCQMKHCKDWLRSVSFVDIPQPFIRTAALQAKLIDLQKFLNNVPEVLRPFGDPAIKVWLPWLNLRVHLNIDLVLFCKIDPHPLLSSTKLLDLAKQRPVQGIHYVAGLTCFQTGKDRGASKCVRTSVVPDTVQFRRCAAGLPAGGKQ